MVKKMKKFYIIVVVFCLLIGGIVVKNHFFQSPELKISSVVVEGEVGYFLSIRENSREFKKITAGSGYYVTKTSEGTIIVSRKEGNYVKVMEFSTDIVLDSKKEGVWIFKNPKISIRKIEGFENKSKKITL